jgi:AraC-like DNA-binding protein
MISSCYQLNASTPDFSVLDDVIETLRFRGSIFFHSDLAAPWGISLPTITMPRFHVSLDGSFYIGVDSETLKIKPMDILLIPGGDMHWIADQTDRELISHDQASYACDLNKPFFCEGKITNRVMCGVIEYDKSVVHPIIDILPSIFHLCDIKSDDNIWLTVTLIDAEIKRTNKKRNNIIDRLTEVLFMQLINQYTAKNPHLSGFLAALNEPRLNRVLQLIHRNPEKKWSVTLISETVGMSRATLLRKFNTALGVSPMVYVTRWRMTKAYQQLKYTNLPLNDSAESIGFSDARTFSSAFQRNFGYTATALRRKVSESGE